MSERESLAKMNGHIKRAEDYLRDSREAINSLEDDVKALQVLALAPKIYFAAENAPRAAQEARLQINLANYRVKELESAHESLKKTYLSVRESQEALKARNKELMGRIVQLERSGMDLRSERDGPNGETSHGEFSGDGQISSGFILEQRDGPTKRFVNANNNGERAIEKKHRARKTGKIVPQEGEGSEINTDGTMITGTPSKAEQELKDAKKEISALKSRLKEAQRQRDRLLANVQSAVPSFIHEARLRDFHNANVQLAQTGHQLQELQKSHDWAVGSYWSVMGQLNAAKAANIELTTELDEARIENEELRRQLEEHRPEACTGQPDCTSCVYHLTRALRVSQSAENAVLEMVDKANMERMMTWNELQELKFSLAYHQAPHFTAFGLPTIQEEDTEECECKNLDPNGEQQTHQTPTAALEDSDDEDGDSDDDSVVFVLESEAAESRAAMIKPPPSSAEDAQVDAVVVGHRSASVTSATSWEVVAPKIATDADETEGLSKSHSPSVKPLAEPQWHTDSVLVADSIKLDPTDAVGENMVNGTPPASRAPRPNGNTTPGTIATQSASTASARPTTTESTTPIPAPNPASDSRTARRQRVLPEAYGFARRSFLTHLTGLKPESKLRPKRSP